MNLLLISVCGRGVSKILPQVQAFLNLSKIYEWLLFRPSDHCHFCLALLLHASGRFDYHILSLVLNMLIFIR